jgi:hypothetical protein
MSRNICGSVQDTGAWYRDEIFRLRIIFRSAQVRKELRIRSRYGWWRFFDVTDTGIAGVVAVQGSPGGSDESGPRMGSDSPFFRSEQPGFAKIQSQGFRNRLF